MVRVLTVRLSVCVPVSFVIVTRLNFQLKNVVIKTFLKYKHQLWLMPLQVLVNLYSSHMDPEDWQQPQHFRPERFLDQSGNVIDRHRVIAFSLGRPHVRSVLSFV